ncbi:MAG: DUF3575 domain-containing protein [Bacteroidia bacterium]|nr:DUF3575 domain-containing protein [Bacteroidia bacterium]MCX7651669.1 DUF3575 domain-containing protein [Bacteroidia bacterium]MDW8417203.1 DUF3575 domain-containing protein [Bacteroidia bacterium]
MYPSLRVVFVAVWLGSLGAQEVDTRVPQLRRPVIKFFPLAAVDPFQYTLHLGLETPINRESSVQVEGGWVYGHLGEDLGTNTGDNDFTQSGFKVRVALRNYFSSNRASDRPLYTLTGGYISLVAGYQHYNQNFGYIDTTGMYNPSPIVVGVPYERRIQAFMGGFMLGYQQQMGSRLTFDIYTGFGIRYSTHDWRPLAPPYQYRLAAVGDFVLRRGSRPIPFMGFSLGWILR